MKFTPKQFLIIACLLAARGPITIMELGDLLYGDDPDGGPDCLDTIRVQIHWMNKGVKGRYAYPPRLPPLGISIVCVWGPHGRASGYRVEEVT
jgi:hypothetical protein